MTCNNHVSSIQEMVDGTIGSIRRAELEQHLQECDSCRSLLADLEKIRDAAASLDRPAPPDRVWLQIAGRLRQEGRIRDAEPAPVSRRRPMAVLALAATLVLAVGASLVLLYPWNRAVTPAPAPATASGNAAPAPSVESVQNEVDLAQQNYESAIAKLQQIANANAQVLDPNTAAVLQKNTGVLDQAIADAKAGVRQEPTNVAARESLLEALKQKVSLLQDTIALMNEMRKGNPAGAARIVNKT